MLLKNVIQKDTKFIMRQKIVLRAETIQCAADNFHITGKVLVLKQKNNKSKQRKVRATFPGADPVFFLRGVAPLRNDLNLISCCFFCFLFFFAEYYEL